MTSVQAGIVAIDKRRKWPQRSLRSQSWTWLLRNVVLPTGDLWYRQHLMQRLKFLEQAQWWDRERLLNERDRWLARLVRIAAQDVAFYRELFEKAGVSPEEIRNLADLRRLPVIGKNELRPCYPDATTRDTGHRTYESGSSGSTGTNFSVLEDYETAGFYRASFLLALEWAGWLLGEPHVQVGCTPSRSPDRKLKDLVLRCQYVSVYDMTDERLDETLQLIDRRRILHLWGYPGSLYFLAKRALKAGWNIPLRSVVTWGDNLYHHYRQAIELAFGVRVLDTYGCGEGMQVAAQCGYGAHYHVHMLDTIVEYLDDNDQPVSPGEIGHVVVTRLHPGPMPLIRYRLGDLAIPGRDACCPCGRGYELIDSIHGRDLDVVVTPSGNRLVVHFFTGILEHFHEVACFQIIQTEPDCLVVSLVPTHSALNLNEVGKRVQSALISHGAGAMRIYIDWVTSIPLTSSGKRRFVISNIPSTEALVENASAIRWSS